MTPLRDMENEAECAAFLVEMAQEVGRRLRKNRLYAGGVKISIRDTKLCSREFQCTLPTPTMHTDVIARAAVQLLKKHYRWQNPLRSASVTAIQLTTEHTPAQMDILYDPAFEERRDHLDQAIDTLRQKYGSHSICSASYFTLTSPSGKQKLISPDRDWSPAFSLGEGLRDRPVNAIPFGTLF
jgi:DNA polymerase-4